MYSRRKEEPRYNLPLLSSTNGIIGLVSLSPPWSMTQYEDEDEDEALQASPIVCDPAYYHYY